MLTLIFRYSIDTNLVYEQLVPLLRPELHDVQVLDAELLGQVASHPHVVWGASIYNVFAIIKKR